VSRSRPASASPSPHAVEAASDERYEPPCPIVGIGASAGGLKVFQELLENLAPDSKVAYVLIPHLDPRHESLLSAILSKATKMPVDEAKDGTRLRGGHVYVIAPNTVMTLVGDTLRLTPRVAARERGCIDHFMISLAEECRERAVGVLLSGTASDGTAGMGAIKAEGGITLAQDETAEFPEMPQSAIAAGHVDFVLPPKAIAEELARIARHLCLPRPLIPMPNAAGRLATDGAAAVTMVLEIIQRETGVEFAGYKRATVERRIARRMAIRRLSEPAEYLRCLESDPSEIRALHNELLISVTSFFRDPEVFEALKDEVFPALLEGRTQRDPIRIWVPGCATGEEAYSLVIALLECQERRESSVPVQVYATDISDVAINKARLGVYDDGALLPVSAERQAKYFVKTERGHQLVKAIRDVVVFARQDLTRDPPFSRIDLLSCRNVLIYLGPALQKRAIPLFHYSLNDKGFLLLGASESVERYGDLFRPINKKRRIFGKISAKSSPRYQFGSDRAWSQPRLGASKVEEQTDRLDVQVETDRALLSRYAPSGAVIDEDGRVVQIRGETGLYLRPSPGKPSFSIYKMARAELVVELASAIRAAKKSGESVRREHVRIDSDGDVERAVNIEVMPLRAPASGSRHYVVLFESAPPREAGRRRSKKDGARAADSTPEEGDARERELARLRDELRLNVEYQQAVVERLEAANEELHSANEEVQSSNEEFQSTNEELETSKEELQSASEELGTLNDELQTRNVELGQLSSDLQNVLANAQIPIAIVDTSFRLRHVTAPAEKLLNVLQSDVGRRLTTFKLNVRVDDIEEMLRSVAETMRPVVAEVLDTKGKWWALHVRPYRTQDQRIEGAVIIFVDIDEQRRALRAAEEAREFLTAIVDTVRDPLLVLDGDLRVEMANAPFYEVFRAHPTETAGRRVYDLGNGQWNVPRLRQLLEEVLPKDSEFRDMEVEHEFEDIGRKVMLLHGRRIQLQAGRLQRILLVIEDISERRDRERRDQFLGEVSLALSSSLDYDGVLAALAQLSVPRLADCCLVDMVGDGGGIRLAAAAPENWVERMSEPDEALDAGAVLDRSGGPARVIRTGVAELHPDLTPQELAALAKSRKHLELLDEMGVRSAMIVPLAVLGRALGAITFYRAKKNGPYTRKDLDWAEEWARRAAFAVENARLFGQAQEAIRSRERFLAIASHEFKTPLAALDLQVKLLLDGQYPDPCPLPPLKKSFEMLSRQTTKFSTLIDQLLDLARIEGGKLEFEDVDLDLSALWRHIAGRFKDALARAGSTLTLHIAQPIKGCLDRLRMDQVATNLISNAVKYGRGKPIEIRMEAVAGGVRITVKDDGIGIAKDDQAKIFEKLGRTVEARRYGGLGLGLFISQRIVEHYGGTIHVDSELGRGSVFTVDLPLGRAVDIAPEAAAIAGGAS